MVVRCLVIWNNDRQVMKGGIEWDEDVSTCWTWTMDDLALHGLSVRKMSVRCIFQLENEHDEINYN